MNAKEAAADAGLSVWTIQKFANKGAFAATKPNGPKGGWEICPLSFREWQRLRRLKGANAPGRAAIKRGSY